MSGGNVAILICLKVSLAWNWVGELRRILIWCWACSVYLHFAKRPSRNIRQTSICMWMGIRWKPPPGILQLTVLEVIKVDELIVVLLSMEILSHGSIHSRTADELRMHHCHQATVEYLMFRQAFLNACFFLSSFCSCSWPLLAVIIFLVICERCVEPSSCVNMNTHTYKLFSGNTCYSHLVTKI